MSRLQALVADLCPNGVEYKEIGSIGSVFGGLTGKTKEDFSNEGARYVSYVNVFNNVAVDGAVDDFVRITQGERQRQLQRGDILFTGSSETAGDVGMSSVVTVEPREPLYLNSFCIGFRLNDPGILEPDFSKYLFRSENVRRQIVRTASGVTRFNVSKARLAKVQVPVPPREIQIEIAEFLDTLASLTSELTSELIARKKQYKHYRDQLLSFVGGEAEWKPLAELGEFIRGKRFTKADFVADGEDGVSVIHYGEIYTRYGTWADRAISKVRSDMAGSLRYAEPGDVVLTDVGETVEDVGKAVAWMGSEKVAIHDHSYAFRHSLNPRYVSYCMQTDSFVAKKAKYVARTKVNTLLINGFSKIEIPVPYPSEPEKSLAEQARIVAILDKFEALTTSLSEGLPREIELRQKQYEYYRDLLLSFPKPEAANAIAHA